MAYLMTDRQTVLVYFTWPTKRAGVKRNFWPVLVFQLFCFSE